MKWTKKPVFELSALLAMAAIVLVLGVLQFRWATEISRTEQERLTDELATSVRTFDQEFSYDFERLCESFELDFEAGSSTLESRAAHQYSKWASTAPRSGLIAGVHIWKLDEAHYASLESMDLEKQQFGEAAWPARLDPLHQYLKEQIPDLYYYEDARDAMYFPWRFYGTTPALIRPIYEISFSEKESDMDIEPVGFLVVELNAEILSGQYLPELVNRHFGMAGERTFGVAVRSGQPPYIALVPPSPSFPIATKSPDAALNLIDSASEEAKRRGHPTIEASDATQQWQLVVQHPAGSLVEAVASWRRRNLAISFGLLAVLSAGMILIFLLARRSRQLARLQVEFVAGVSHELCTPLAIINSAAENLADGVVEGPSQMAEYGGLIRDQGRRLERMIDEVLAFSSGQTGRATVELRQVEIANLIARSLSDSEPMLRDAGFAVEKEISTGLPPVMADPSAVVACIENLFSNAMKYANGTRWVAIRARVESDQLHPEVQVSVEDKGIGIPAADITKIFEPFYRVQAVRESQIRGVGLGLYLVKRIMEGMGGHVTVSSELGRGSHFILHFPIANSGAGRHSGAA
jgi:signal transduction histidine kinase